MVQKSVKQKNIEKKNLYDKKGNIIGTKSIEMRLPANKLQIVYLDRKGRFKRMWAGKTFDIEGGKRPIRRAKTTRTPRRAKRSRREMPAAIPGMMPGVGPEGLPPDMMNVPEDWRRYGRKRRR